MSIQPAEDPDGEIDTLNATFGWQENHLMIYLNITLIWALNMLNFKVFNISELLWLVGKKNCGIFAESFLKG